jgi:hypothetical protein
VLIERPRVFRAACTQQVTIHEARARRIAEAVAIAQRRRADRPVARPG